MKYRLLKSLPGVEVGTTIDTLVNPQTYSERKMWEFIASFGSDNDFFEPIKESKWWEPKEWGDYYDFYCDKECNSTEWDTIAISAGLAFKTKEEAEKQLKLMQAITRCKRYLVERDMLLSSEEVIHGCIRKSTVMYKIGTGLLVETYDTYVQYSPYGYIKLKDNALKFIQDCQEDLLLIHKPC